MNALSLLIVGKQRLSGIQVCKDEGGSQRDKDSSPNLSFNDLKQKEIEIKEALVLQLSAAIIAN